MARILSQAQGRQMDADMAELSRYRALGLTPEGIEALLFPDPAPAPINLWVDAATPWPGLLEDDGFDPAQDAQ